MALPLPPGLTPAEVAFLCENEFIYVVPRQRMDSIPLLSGPTPPLRPPHPAELPLWLALLLHRQNRAQIQPPAWLSREALESILQIETSQDHFSKGLHEYPTHQQSHTAALPYHYLTLAHLLLTLCASSFDPSTLSQLSMLIRSIREVRQSKMREGVKNLEGGGVTSLRGVGALEVCEERGFVVGVMDGLRKLGAGKETTRRENEEMGGDEMGTQRSRRDGTVEDDDEDQDIEMSLEPSIGY